MSFSAKRVILVALTLGVGACVSRGEIEEIKKNQEKILAKLDAMARTGAGQPAPQRPRGPDPAKVYAFPVEDAPVKGPNDAWVTVVEVSDFQCPFCKRAADTLKEVEQKYGKDVRFVFKNNPLPFHNRATPAAMAGACAAEQGKFWKMHDSMFSNQDKLEDANLESYAKEAGLDMGKWKGCVSANKFKGRIDQEIAKAAQLGARGTPAFFINGRFLSGAQPLPAFQALIDEELKKAKDSGVSKGDYYAKQVVEKGEKAM
jgi:protein-disulfide isomerase